MSNQKWTKKTLQQSADKYQTLKKWRQKEPSAYGTALKLKLVSKITKNLIREQLPPDYWNKKTLKIATKNFKTFGEWFKKDRKSYAAARRRGLLYDKDISGHLNRLLHSKWTEKEILIDASKYNYKSEWKAKNPSAYKAARERGYLERATQHMELLGHRYKRCLYSIEIKGKKIIYIGLTHDYKTRIKEHLKTKRFKKLTKEYGKGNLIIKKLTRYLDQDKAAILEIDNINKKKEEGYVLLNKAKGGSLGGAYKIWTKEKSIESAKNFKHKMKWKKEEGGAYWAAIRGGYIDEATKHMEILNPKGRWSKKGHVLNDAKKYQSRSDWQKHSSGAYEAAKNNGWFQEAVAHMPRRKSS